MKKLLLVITLCLVCAFCLTACKNDEPPVNDNPTSDNQNQDNNQNDDNQNDDNQNDNVVYSEGLEFTTNGDGTCYVSGIGTCTDTDVKIPRKSPDGDSVTTIGDYAFYGCDSLTSVTITDSVTTIGKEAFSWCISLTSIVVDADNQSYKSIDGNLYTKDGKTLVQYAIGKADTYFTIPDSITTIGNWAFSNCTSLTSVTIPDSVTTIGDYAFGCHSLTSIVVDENNPNYKSIDGNLYTKDGKTLVQYAIGKTDTHFTIPDSVTTIGSSAFRECISLTSVTIPDSVTTIGVDAFCYCTSLTSVTIGDSVTTIGVFAFAYCTSLTSVTISDSVNTIGEWAFLGCTSLTSVTIPDSVNTIGYGAFDGCTSLTDVYYTGSEADWEKISIDSNNNYLINANITYNYGNQNDNVVYSEGFAFTSNGDGTCSVSGIGTCTDTDVKIPPVSPAGDSVTTIGSGAFADCDSITSVTIPNSVTTIGNYAFTCCDSLTSVTIPDSVTTIGFEAFASCTGLTSVTIGDSVTAIGYAAFASCTGLTSVTIGDSVTTIGGVAFGGCTSLTSVTIGNGVTAIGDYAFQYCYSLASVTIPDSVTTICFSAFDDCPSLTDVYYKGSEAEWAEISIGSGNDYLINANITYNYTE